VNINTAQRQTQTFQYFIFTSQSVYISFDNILLGNFVSRKKHNYLLEKLIFKNITKMYLFTLTPADLHRNVWNLKF